jgi:hypothetical protein
MSGVSHPATAAGKIVPHLAVPAGKIVPHAHIAGFVAAEAEPAEEPDDVEQLVDRLNGILEGAGLGRPVEQAEEYLVTVRLADGTDAAAVLAALHGAGAEGDDVRRARQWAPDEAAPDEAAADEAAADPGMVTGDSRTVPH